MIRRLECMSIVMSSFFIPGNSKVAVNSLCSFDSWTSILSDDIKPCWESETQTKHTSVSKQYLAFGIDWWKSDDLQCEHQKRHWRGCRTRGRMCRSRYRIERWKTLYKIVKSMCFWCSITVSWTCTFIPNFSTVSVGAPDFSGRFRIMPARADHDPQSPRTFLNTHNTPVLPRLIKTRVRQGLLMLIVYISAMWAYVSTSMACQSFLIIFDLESYVLKLLYLAFKWNFAVC